MEAVKSFNAELAGLYECKPPISKAKMTAITKAAIRAIKFYKHVVQSVEKFIQKCKTEYKIPGLYVIDSIVRQSRHQFSIEKDVFAPRFAKNISVTFFYLFKCPQEEKSRVIRVLNLWQKNHIFSEDVIQPLFDLADPNHPIQKEIGNMILQKTTKTKSAAQGPPVQEFTPQLQHTPQQQHTPQHAGHSNSSGLTPNSNTPVLVSVPHHSSGSSQAITTAAPVSSLDPMLIQQIQQILMKTADEGPVASAVAALGLQQHQSRPLAPFSENMSLDSVMTSLSVPIIDSLAPTVPPPTLPVQEIKGPIMLPRLSQSGDYDGRTLPFLPVDTSQPPPGYHVPGFPNAPLVAEFDSQSQLAPTENCNRRNPPEEGEDSDASEENKENHQGSQSDRRRRSRSKSSSRSKRRRRSDSRSRYRRSRSRGRRSRSRERDRRDRDRNRDRSRRDQEKYEREQEREQEREKERERKKRGLPPIKNDHLSVCSTTLWVGHLSKLVHQEEISDTFGEYGDIISIDLIPPRGCAFVCMNRRQDAARALLKLKNHRMQNKAITLAWAPGKGVKGKDLKDYWEVDHGCCYIPYSKLSPMNNVDLDAFEEGGVIDEDTVPDRLKGRYASTADHGPPQVHPVPMGSTPTHLPPPVVNMGLPPPQNPVEPGPPLVRPHMDKDDRDERHPIPPPSLVHPYGMPGIPPPGSIPLIPPNLPPPVPLGHPVGLPPMTLANVGSQPLLGVPNLPPEPHIPIGNPANIQDGDNMDVEMEDVEKPQPAAHLERAIPSPSGGHLGGVKERQLIVGGKPSIPPESLIGAPRPDGLEHQDIVRRTEDSEAVLNGSPNPVGQELRIFEDARKEGFAGLPLGAVPLPDHRFPHLPPRTVGIMPHEHHGFDPRVPQAFGHPRPLLPHPSVLGARRDMLPELAVPRPQGPMPVPPRGIEFRPIGGLIPPGLTFQGPRRLVPPHHGLLDHRFHLVPHPRPPIPGGGFPRFGIIREPRPLVPLPPTPLQEEEVPGDWIEKHRPRPALMEEPSLEMAEERRPWEGKTVSEMISLEAQLAEGKNMLPRRTTDPPLPEKVAPDRLSVTELLEEKAPDSTGPLEGVPPPLITIDNRFPESNRSRDDDRRREDGSRERDWDRHRDRDRNRDRDRDRDWDSRRRDRDWEQRGREHRERERGGGRGGRERDWMRERDRWGSSSNRRGRDRDWTSDREGGGGFGRSRGGGHPDRGYSREDGNEWQDRSSSSFHRPSRWGGDESRERAPIRGKERREPPKKQQQTADGPLAEEEMTWQNWTSFTNNFPPLPEPIAVTESPQPLKEARPSEGARAPLLPTPNSSTAFLPTPKLFSMPKPTPLLPTPVAMREKETPKRQSVMIGNTSSETENGLLSDNNSPAKLIPQPTGITTTEGTEQNTETRGKYNENEPKVADNASEMCSAEIPAKDGDSKADNLAKDVRSNSELIVTAKPLSTEVRAPNENFLVQPSDNEHRNNVTNKEDQRPFVQGTNNDNNDPDVVPSRERRICLANVFDDDDIDHSKGDVKSIRDASEMSICSTENASEPLKDNDNWERDKMSLQSNSTDVVSSVSPRLGDIVYATTDPIGNQPPNKNEREPIENRHLLSTPNFKHQELDLSSLPVNPANPVSNDSPQLGQNSESKCSDLSTHSTTAFQSQQTKDLAVVSDSLTSFVTERESYSSKDSKNVADSSDIETGS